jgi:hypothetical protein
VNDAQGLPVADGTLVTLEAIVEFIRTDASAQQEVSRRPLDGTATVT